jgi:hypothetical protein
MIKVISETVIINNQIVKVNFHIGNDVTSTDIEKATATYVLAILNINNAKMNSNDDVSTILGSIGKSNDQK